MFTDRLSDEDAIQIARINKIMSQKSCYLEPRKPPDWVIEAIKEAYIHGWNAKRISGESV